MDSLHNLEQGRLQLEQQAAELDKMLDTWRKWEVDYEILKEEITSAKPKTPEMLVGEATISFTQNTHQKSIAEDFTGVLLNQQEIEKLLRNPNGVLRSTKQVVDLLSHRLEYVKGNVDSLSKRRQVLSEQLDESGETLPLDMSDQDGLPLTEIVEELDEDGNIISSSTATPNKDLVEKLQRSGSAMTERTGIPVDKTADHVPSTPREQTADPRTKSSDRAQAVAQARAKQLADSLQDDEESDDDDDGKRHNRPSAQLATAQLLGSIADVTTSGDSALGPMLVRKPDVVPASVKIMGPSSGPQAVIPEGENIEDALLRRDMLDYNLHEVGAVVAEMDIDGESEEDIDELEELDDADLDSDVSEEEDEYGRSLRPMITESYRREMMELERQLGAGRIQNLGPEPGRISPSPERTVESPKTDKAESRKNIPAPAKGVLKKAQSEDSKSRGVRFADSLDVSHGMSGTQTAPIEVAMQERISTAPLADEVQERALQPSESSVHAPPRKASRFKSSRMPVNDQISNVPATAASVQKFAGPLLDIVGSQESQRDETPQGPANATLADVIEHSVQHGAKAPDEDYDDPALQRRQMASDYYAKRNAMIRSQGGFRASDAAAVQLNEDGEEIRPKMSRFKAARLGKNQ